MPLPLLAISMGDPGGIGPEVIVKSLATVRGRARVAVLGIDAVMREAARGAGVAPDWETSLPGAACTRDITVIDYGGGPAWPAAANAAAGDLSFRFVDDAIAMARAGPAAAVVTGPICKQAWSLAGHHFPGHTELLADRCGAANTRMMFVSPTLRVILQTAHIPIAAVPAALNTAKIADTIRIAHRACRDFGVAAPRVAVCGLNPHAGEDGLLGTEDQHVIAPAVAAARAEGIDASGPWPADTIFNAAVAGRYDIVLAMYHDQGLIPLKLLARDHAVNYTAGLPIIRTSPDHGTAFDIAGKNQANPGSMIAAIELAITLLNSSPAAGEVPRP